MNYSTFRESSIQFNKGKESGHAPFVREKKRVLSNVDNICQTTKDPISKAAAAERQRRNAEKLSKGLSVCEKEQAGKENKIISEKFLVPKLSRKPLSLKPSVNQTSLLSAIEKNQEVKKLEILKEKEPEPIFDETALANLAIEDDKNDKDGLLVGSYAVDIFKYLRKLEISQAVRCKYLTKQHILTGAMRSVLVDWIFEVQKSFNLLQDTTQIAVSLLDRYLQDTPKVPKDELQLIAVTCIFVASKYEEMYPPSLDDLVMVSANACTKLQILRTELRILKAVVFDIGRAPPIVFLRRYCRVTSASTTAYYFSKYFIDLSLVQYAICHHPPSLLAAAALCLSLFVSTTDSDFSSRLWTPLHSLCSGYMFDDIYDLAIQISNIVAKAPTAKHQSVRLLYTDPKKTANITARPELSSSKLKALAAKATLD